MDAHDWLVSQIVADNDREDGIRAVCRELNISDIADELIDEQPEIQPADVRARARHATAVLERSQSDDDEAPAPTFEEIIEEWEAFEIEQAKRRQRLDEQADRNMSSLPASTQRRVGWSNSVGLTPFWLF